MGRVPLLGTLYSHLPSLRGFTDVWVAVLGLAKILEPAHVSGGQAPIPSPLDYSRQERSAFPPFSPIEVQ